MTNKGIIFNIQRFSVNDGPGIRTTVFFKGCPLGCPWCHNPESRGYGVQELNGNIVGEEYETGKLMREIEKDRLFYDQSGGGVTFSGGEPLAQPAFLSGMLDLCIENGIHTAVDTTGYASSQTIEQIADKANMFLFDLKLMDEKEHFQYTGVSNLIILENLDTLLINKNNVIVRIPLIPGITTTKSNIEKIAVFLLKYKKYPEINLLPYHRIAEGKYNRYGLTNMMIRTDELSNEEVENIKRFFENAGFKVKTGG